jgi:integrase
MGTDLRTRWFQTKFRGVRYRQHPTRKHGVKFDRYFSLRYQVDGRRIEEGCGWSSENWTAEKAAVLLAELKQAAKTGNGKASLRERREEAKSKKEAEAKEKVTFADYWKTVYFPHSKAEKTYRAHQTEQGLFTKWIAPVIGALPFKDVAPIHLERIKKLMADDGKAPRSVQYCLAVIRQCFNDARRHGVFTGDNPVKKVRSPRVDNRRLRFLSPEESDILLEKLKREDQTTHDMALLSLHCGLRASEIFGLTWNDLDVQKGILTVRNTKKGLTRYAHMTTAVKEMLLSREIGEPTALVFPAGRGKTREVPGTFARGVKELKLNDGITDRRDKVCFHTLRHTFASWLVQGGASLYEVKEQLGHRSLSMTERYSHLAPDSGRKTVNILETFVRERRERGKEKATESEII